MVSHLKSYDYTFYDLGPCEEYPEPAGLHLLEMKSGPVNHKKIAEATLEDATLVQVLEYVRNDWP